MQTKTNENKYQNGKIYKITDNNFTECYIGSTIQKLAVRFGEHKRKYAMYNAGKANRTMSFELFSKYGIDNCRILLVESFPCNSKEELTAREAYHVRKTKCLNIRIEGRTHKQWLEDNKEHFKAITKKYREEHRDEIRKKFKAFYQKHRDRRLQENRAYREKNKERLQAHKHQKHECECGGRYTHENKSTHMKTGKHTSYVAKTKTIEI